MPVRVGLVVPLLVFLGLGCGGTEDEECDPGMVRVDGTCVPDGGDGDADADADADGDGDGDGDADADGDGDADCVDPDGDDDGYARVSCGGADCNDVSARIHPQAEDSVGDGVDQNCDGRDGVDQDGDTFASTESGGTDCNDEDESVHPGAADDTGDALDQNCDGTDGVDGDGDSYASLASGGGDCDDADPAVHPDAVDPPGDLIDQNCDGREQSVIFDSLEVIEGGDCDLSGDGQPDNAFGASLSQALGLLNDQVAAAIQDGSLIVLFGFDDLEDPAGQDDAAFAMSFFPGQDGDGDVGNNLSGGAELLVDPEALDPDTCQPTGLLDAGVAGGELLATGDVSVELPLFGDNPTPLDIRDCRVTGTVVAAEGRIHDVADGQICGGLPASALAAVDNPVGLGPRTVLGLLVVGLDILGIRVVPTQPDLDLDGDGLEQLADTNGDGQIDRCTDGDGTIIDGEDCVFDPAIADAYSAVLSYTAIYAQLVGIADPGCAGGG